VGRSGAPVEITVMQTGSYGASADLPAVVQPAAGQLAARAAAGVGREYSIETRLPLTSGDDRRLAASFIDQVVHPDVIHTGAPVEVTRALQRRLDEAGIVNARVYSIDEGGFAVTARGGFRGVSAGGSVGDETRETGLIGASSRGPDGVWYRRDDCLSAARV
jgi:hypothetical protein